jgi:hypothetical protein
MIFKEIKKIKMLNRMLNGMFNGMLNGMLNVLFIESDDQKSLGGSCLRDIRNINEYLSKDGFDHSKRRQTKFLSINNTKIDHCDCDFLKNYQQCFQSFINTVKDGDSVLVCISGHGYQTHNKNSEEKDSMDEYISFGSGIITDNVLYSLLVEKLLNKCNRIVCLVDTCHSGTMFDIDQKKVNKRNVFSLSACLDNQLDSCDISNVGFGGALTVHLLDIPNSLKKLLTEDEQCVKNIVALLDQKLQLLHQKCLLSII